MNDLRGDISFNLFNSTGGANRFNTGSNHPQQHHVPVQLTLDDLNDINQDDDNDDQVNNESDKFSSQVRQELNARHEGRTVNFDTATFENSEDNNEMTDRSGSIQTQFEFSARPPRANKPPTNARTASQIFNNYPDESDFDLSDTKLYRLGMINSIDKEKQKYSNLLLTYSKQFKNPTQQNDSEARNRNQFSGSASTGQQLSVHSPLRNHPSGSVAHSRENSKIALGKYGHILQRESNTPETPASTFISSHTQQCFHEKLSPSTTFTPQSTFLSNPLHQASPISGKDFSQQEYVVNYDIFSGRDEGMNIQRHQQNMPQPGFGRACAGPTAQQGQVIQDYSDPYRISIQSFKNSLFSHPSDAKENEHTQQFEGGLKSKCPSFDPSSGHINNYDLMSSSNQYLGMSSNEIMRSALQVHHLTGNEKSQKPPNHPVYNLGKVLEDSVKMNKQQQQKKRSFSHSGNQDKEEEFESSKAQQFLKEVKHKYYDAFLPDKEKIMNNPLKLMKHRIQSRDSETLQNCSSTLAFIGKEIDNNVQPELNKSKFLNRSHKLE